MTPEKEKQFWCEFFSTHEFRFGDGVYEEIDGIKYHVGWCQRCGVKGLWKKRKILWHSHAQIKITGLGKVVSNIGHKA